MSFQSNHPLAGLVLDVVDKTVKVVAVLIGGFWTWWNYRKSRTYQQKLELEVSGATYAGAVLYGDIQVSVKNIGATNHRVSHHGTFCTLAAVRDDLLEESVRLFKVFEASDKIEPGESINDVCFWRLTDHPETIRWIKLTLRVVSDGVEWTSTRLIHVDQKPHQPRGD